MTDAHIGLPGRRKRWALHQRELADLVGVVSPATISRYESGRCSPSGRAMLALEVVFGKSGRQLFPALYDEVQEEVMRRAAKLDRTLRRKKDPASERKRALLRDMARRAGVAQAS